MDLIVEQTSRYFLRKATYNLKFIFPLTDIIMGEIPIRKPLHTQQGR